MYCLQKCHYIYGFYVANLSPEIKEILHPYNQHFLKSVLDFFMKFLSRPDKTCLQRSNAVVVSVTQSLLGLRGGIYRFLDQEIYKFLPTTPGGTELH